MAATFRCSSCAGELEFSPGQQSLECPYCGSQQAVPAVEGTAEELDFNAHLEQLADGASETEERLTVRCQACAAETTFEPNVTSAECPFCGTNVVLTTTSKRLIRPGSLLPFKIDHRAARNAFLKWIRSRWFAPNALAKIASHDRLQGVYLPFWTYDCRTTSRYRGLRGDEYQVTEMVTVTEGGRRVQRPRRVTKVRWSPVGGTVQNSFDDLLVPASGSVQRDKADRLEPWDLAALVAYDDRYLSGFRAESYQVGLADGFALARPKIESAVRETVRRDIGGDRQQIHQLDVDCHDVTFKHLLLPVWISAYRFKDKVFQFLVNARTGEVQGERPYSWVKITLAVLGGLVVVTLLILAASS